MKSTDKYPPKLKWASWLGRTAAGMSFGTRQMPATCLEEGFAPQSAEHCALITIFRDHPIFQVPTQKTRDVCIFSCCLDSRPSKLFFSKCDGDLAKSFFHRLRFASNCSEKELRTAPFHRQPSMKPTCQGARSKRQRQPYQPKGCCAHECIFLPRAVHIA